MRDFKFICDGCGKKEEAVFNGEHWLEPKNWVRIFDNEKAAVIENEHYCASCYDSMKYRPRMKEDATFEVTR